MDQSPPVAHTVAAIAGALRVALLFTRTHNRLKRPGLAAALPASAPSPLHCSAPSAISTKGAPTTRTSSKRRLKTLDTTAFRAFNQASLEHFPIALTRNGVMADLRAGHPRLAFRG